MKKSSRGWQKSAETLPKTSSRFKKQLRPFKDCTDSRKSSVAEDAGKHGLRIVAAGFIEAAQQKEKAVEII